MEVQQKLSFRGKILLLISGISVALVCLVSYTKYIYAKDYTFLVEASCDPLTQSCYVRDCEDYCPPNELESYTVFAISAADFSSCTDNSCSNVCLNPTTAEKCEEITCDIENGDDCSS